jgi:hypothetical protein
VRTINRNKLKKVLILNSVQGKFPRGGDSWITATINVLENLKGENLCLITSIGLNTWELVACLGGRLGMNQILIIPGRDNNEGRARFAQALSDFALARDRTLPVYADSRSDVDFYSTRDRLAVEMSEIIYPVSVRPGGRLDTLLNEFGNAGKQVREEFKVKWSRDSWTPSYNLPLDRINPELQLYKRDWLTHWTHTRAGPWPGEPSWKFYSDILAGGQEYPRDARATLARIVGENLLRASSWKMPGAEPMISFTALAPADAAGLMRWRKRYTRYSVEPYGLAFRRESLEHLGARPVSYIEPGDPKPTVDEKMFSQSAGRKGNWEAEQEWRLQGDLSLECFGREDLVLITQSKESAEIFRARYDPFWEVIPLFV